MRLEHVLFRLMLVVFVASAFSFGGAWVYLTKEASDWQTLVEKNFEHMKEMATECERTGPRASSACEFYTDAKDRFEKAVEARDAATEWAEVCGLLAVAVPLVVTLLFYSLRWAVTGKLRPLRPS